MTTVRRSPVCGPALLGLLLLGLVPAAAAAPAPAAPAAAAPTTGEVIDRIAAVVNSDLITLREVRRAAAPAMASLGGVRNPELLRQEEQRALQDALDDLIGQLLLAQSAEELKVAAGVEEVDEYVAGIKRQYGWDDAAMTQALAREGSSVEEFRADVKRRLTTSRLVQMKLGPTVKVSEEEVDEALKRQYAGLAKEREVTARHILLLVPEGATPEVEAEVRQRARELLEKARQPDADFGQLARLHSEGPGGDRGGEIGSFTKGQLDPAFEQAAFAAEVGEVVGPVRTRYGYHIIQVTRSRELEAKDEEVLRKEVRAKLRQEGMERSMKRWIQELRRKAYVDVKLAPTTPVPGASPAGAVTPPVSGG